MNAFDEQPTDSAAGNDRLREHRNEESAEIIRRGEEIFERDVRPMSPSDPPNDFYPDRH